MTKFIITALAASVSLGSAVYAEGDYYPGAAKDRPVVIDTIATGSISNDHRIILHNDSVRNLPVIVDRGDYFQGASRPN